LFESLTNAITSSISIWGYPAIFILMTLSSMCMPVSSEVVILFAGFLAYQGQLDLFPIIIWATAGNIFGSVLAYYIGMLGGRPFIEKYGKYVFVKQKEIAWADHWFEKYGHETVFFGRMIPVVRAVISVPAGISRMNMGKFLVYSTLGALPWDAGLAYAGYALGSQWHNITKYFNAATIIVVAIIFVAIAYFVYAHVKRKNKKNG
jgi:membrane protein DedA with SNARE-associated domain